jgi:hypothetical protein
MAVRHDRPSVAAAKARLLSELPKPCPHDLGLSKAPGSATGQPNPNQALKLTGRAHPAHGGDKCPAARAGNLALAFGDAEVFNVGKPLSVFVSYSHKDREIVTAAIEIQQDLNYAAFIDFRDTPPGMPWQETHSEVIRRAAVLVLLWSEHAAGSEHVAREWRLALEARVKVIPVLMDDTPLPEELSHIHALAGFRALIDDFRWCLRFPVLGWLGGGRARLKQALTRLVIEELKRGYVKEASEVARAAVAAGVVPAALCPHCEAVLRAMTAKQCFACGEDWHDPCALEGELAEPSASADRPRE